MQSEPEGRESSVLVVDDDPLTLKSVGIILRAAGFRVVTASDGATALELLRREKPRVACFDVMMGPINGLDLCRLVKSDESLCDIHVLLLTARAMPKERQEGLAAGADDYVSKPFSNKDLVARVRQAYDATAPVEGDR